MWCDLYSVHNNVLNLKVREQLKHIFLMVLNIKWQLWEKGGLQDCWSKTNPGQRYVYCLYSIGEEVFEEFWNVVLEENGKDKMVRESN